MQVQSVQPTPNPNAFKFLTDGNLVASGTLSLASAGEADRHPIGPSLFAIAGVESLFFCDNFVTVSMTAEADWRAVHAEVVKTVEAHEGVEAAAPPEAPAAAASAATVAEGDAELLAQINGLLDDRVRPALAGDGGGLEVLGLDGKTLRIRYQGACGSCPSSISGTLNAIQNLLQTEVDDELQVVPA